MPTRLRVSKNKFGHALGMGGKPNILAAACQYRAEDEERSPLYGSGHGPRIWQDADDAWAWIREYILNVTDASGKCVYDIVMAMDCKQHDSKPRDRVEDLGAVTCETPQEKAARKEKL